MDNDEYTDWQDGDLKVVVNHEEQFSIWPLDRETPKGWVEVGVTGKKKECLDFIEKVWTDMRPLSLRKHMDGDACKSAWDNIRAELKRREEEKPESKPEEAKEQAQAASAEA